MIRIEKPSRPPEVLESRGLAAGLHLQEAFEADIEAYRAGLAHFSFDRTVYADDSVKQALERAQYGKCAFCEAKIRHVAYGDVEHFRPKAGFRQLPDGPLERPGYFWLAYSWSNLLLACQLCNQRHKRNHFPLARAEDRCRDHRGELGKEKPLFLHPSFEDPEEHIQFEEEEPVPVNGSPRGVATIEALGLSREELREHRSDRYRLLSRLRDFLDIEALLGHELVEEARAELRLAIQDAAEYASMARSLLRERPLP
jgi:uncharacterized protein (TIGR02646 family)